MLSTVSPAMIKLVAKEITQLQVSLPEGIRLQVNEENLSQINAFILGPEGTPYAEGCFKIAIHFTNDYPNGPPKCFFMTKIFHPNVSATGEICVNTLKKDWHKELGLKQTIKCLLIVPNPESALNEDAGKLLLEAYEDYAQRAKLMTKIHASSRTDYLSLSPPQDSVHLKPAASIDTMEVENDEQAQPTTVNCLPPSTTTSATSSPLKRVANIAALEAKKLMQAKKRSVKRL